jgi:Integrase
MAVRSVSGHIETRKDRYGNIRGYKIVIDLGKDPLTGKRKRLYWKADTEEEANIILIQKQAEYLNQELLQPNQMSVSQYMDLWYETFVVNQLSESSVYDYKEKIKVYIKPSWGHIKLQVLSSLDIQKVVNKWFIESPYTKGKPLAYATISHILRVLRTSLNKAVDLEYIKKNPMKGVSIKNKNDTAKLQAFSENEVIQLFDAAKGTDMELIITFLFDTLARRGELLGARWSDLCMETKTLTIQHTFVRTLDGCKFQDKTKTKSSRRSMVLTDYTMSLLMKEKQKQRINKMKYGKEYHDNDLIICQEDGRPYQTTSMTQKWRRFLRKNGIRHIKLLGSRHSAISQMFALGLSPRLIQDRAGHQSLEITMQTYVHIGQEQKAKTAQDINDKLFGKVVNN